jgi:L-amino acid N-acyltransferase YncA
MEKLSIKPADISHLDRIIEIYNQAINEGFATADTKPYTVKDKIPWFESHDSIHPIYISIMENEVVGWLSVSPYRPGRMALSKAREVSYYVDSNYRRRNIASQLLQHAINEAKNLGAESYIAILLDKNMASINILEKFNFQIWGHLPGIADFDGVRCGHLYYGKHLLK